MKPSAEEITSKKRPRGKYESNMINVALWNIFIKAIPFALFILVNVLVNHYATLNPHSWITFAIEGPLLLICFGIGCITHAHYNNRVKCRFHFWISFSIDILYLILFILYSTKKIPVPASEQEPNYYHIEYNYLMMIFACICKYGFKGWNDLVNLADFSKLNLKWRKGAN